MPDYGMCSRMCPPNLHSKLNLMAGARSTRAKWYRLGGLAFQPVLADPKRLIFYSSVDRGIPSLAAAPEGPAMRPWQSARAASIISTSRSDSVESPSRGFRDSADDCRGSADSRFSQLPSTKNVSVSLRMTARSRTFCNSRILPGQA